MLRRLLVVTLLALSLLAGSFSLLGTITASSQPALLAEGGGPPPPIPGLP